MIAKKSILLIIAFFFMSFTVHIGATDAKNQLYDLNSSSLKNSLSGESVDYLIITTDDFESTLEPLAIWKTQKGLVSKIELVSDIQQKYSGRNTPEKIKNCIIDYQSNNNTQWVLLAGDQNHVPSGYVLCLDGFPYDGDFVRCDSFYTDLDNNWDLNNDGLWGSEYDEYDFEPEVYVGRLTANNENEMENLVQRILNYEKNPPVGSWMSHAMFAGSILQFDQDWNNDSNVDYGECDGNRVNNFIKNLLPDNWTSIFLAQTQGVKGSDNYSDIQLEYNNLKFAINEGCSIGTIFAHGSPQSMGIDQWVTDYDGDMLFDYTDDPYYGDGTPIDVMVRSSFIDTSYALLAPEDDKLGLFYLGSCSTGTFDDADDCLSEYFLKNAAIGCVAASHVAWGEDQWYERDHGGWFIEGLGFRFWEQLFQYNQPGKALALAKADYVSDRDGSSESNDYPEWEDKTLKQYNLLGDPEVPIWLLIPKELNISEIAPQNGGTADLNLLITADEKPVQGVIITYTKKNIPIWKGETNENGTIVVPISQVDDSGDFLTASKAGFLPDQISFDIQIQNEEQNDIAGYDILIFSIIILSFICLSSIYYKHSSSKKKAI